MKDGGRVKKTLHQNLEREREGNMRARVLAFLMAAARAAVQFPWPISPPVHSASYTSPSSSSLSLLMTRLFSLFFPRKVVSSAMCISLVKLASVPLYSMAFSKSSSENGYSDSVFLLRETKKQPKNDQLVSQTRGITQQQQQHQSKEHTQKSAGSSKP